MPGGSMPSPPGPGTAGAGTPGPGTTGAGRPGTAGAATPGATSPPAAAFAARHSRQECQACGAISAITSTMMVTRAYLETRPASWTPSLPSRYPLNATTEIQAAEPSALKAYLALARLTADRALAAGQLSPNDAERLLDVLGDR